MAAAKKAALLMFPLGARSSHSFHYHPRHPEGILAGGAEQALAGIAPVEAGHQRILTRRQVFGERQDILAAVEDLLRVIPVAGAAAQERVRQRRAIGLGYEVARASSSRWLKTW